MVIEFDCWAFIVCRDHSRLLRVNSDELQAKKDRLVELQTTCKMTQYVTYVYSTLRWQWCIAPDAEYDAINHVFFQCVLRGPRSSSIAWSQVWLGLFAGRFQSGGTCRIHAACCHTLITNYSSSLLSVSCTVLPLCTIIMLINGMSNSYRSVDWCWSTERAISNKTVSVLQYYKGKVKGSGFM